KRAIRDALCSLVNRHEILRTAFRLLPGMTIPLQVVADAKILWKPEINVDSQDAMRPHGIIDKMWYETNAGAIDEWWNTLIESCLVTFPQGGNILLLSLPALLTDASGLKNLVRDLSCLYAAALENRPLQDDPIQHVVISEWLNELIDSEEALAGRGFWKDLFNKLDGAEVFDAKLPLEAHPGQTKSFQPQIVSLTINPALVTRLKLLSSQYDAALPELCLTCWQILLWRLTQSANVIVGAAFDGRTDEELETALGLLTKYLPVHFNFSRNLTIGGAVQQIGQSLRDASAWQWCFTWDDIAESGKSGADRFFPFCFEFDDLSAKHTAGDVTLSTFKRRVYINRFKVKLDCIQRND